MATQDFKRKLTAILSADVKGYSRLMREDEEATVRTITTYREVIGSVVRKHRGEVVDSPGDNILAEFASVVDAVRGAVEIQEELKVRNAELPENRRMEFRIGINLGDVIHEKERIYGDGVNVAARVESLADAGGICVSRSVFNQVKDKLTLGYENLGEHSVKNIDEPVRIYRVLMDPKAAGKVIGEERVDPKRGLRVALAAVIVLLLLVGGLLIWRTASPPVEVASVERMAYPLPDKPSLAVLPFDNLSGDSSQDYFSDGITETIITALSNVSNLFVIARNSSFTYKGKPVKVQKVAEELGVRYVLEGGIQKTEDRVRVTAQLIDALTGHHLWAERYDRKLSDIFALQDDITEQITMALQVKLTEGEQARMRRRHTNNAEAYGYVLRGIEVYRIFTKEDNIRARKLVEKAAELDPNYAHVWQYIGWTHYMAARFGWTDTPNKALVLAEELAQKTLSKEESDSWAYALLSVVYMARRQHDEAVAYGEKALALAPNLADIFATVGVTYLNSGKPKEAVELINKAMRYSPYYPSWYLGVLGLGYRFTGKYKEAIEALENWRTRSNPRSELPHLYLAITYIEAGREEDAQHAIAEVFKRKPKASIKGYMKAKTFIYKDPAEIERAFASLRKAGLPESPPLPLPDKPSIAVLPFENMSDDPKQEYFSDGLTDQIINGLSKTPYLFVIARNSTFTYKGKAVKVQKVAEDLGVKYILEGSVQRTVDRIRITAQLIDATTGHHLWSERYDRNLKVKDIFAIQDDITMEIMKAMQVKLTRGEQARLWAKQETTNLSAYLKGQEGRAHMLRITKEDVVRGRQLFEEAIALDPKFASAYAFLGWVHFFDARFGWTESRGKSINMAFEFAQKALEMDDTLDYARALLSAVYLVKRDHEKAITEAELALDLNPNGALVHNTMAGVLGCSGRWEESIIYGKKSIRLNPFPPPNSFHWLGRAYFMTEQYDEAIQTFKKAIDASPNYLPAHAFLAASYSSLGREAEAAAATEEVFRINPKFSLESYAKTLPYKNNADVERYVAALKKAGLK
jgi:adenylate cyclase